MGLTIMIALLLLLFASLFFIVGLTVATIASMRNSAHYILESSLHRCPRSLSCMDFMGVFRFCTNATAIDSQAPCLTRAPTVEVYFLGLLAPRFLEQLVQTP